jgi:DNA-binding response OmpR family regulator
MRLLLVEDERRLADLVQNALERAGFGVDAVGRYADAWDRAAAVCYDAAVLDLGLPDGDGLELLSRMRAAGCRWPVLLLTARDAVEDRVDGLNRGADDYLVKPFAMAELVARLQALLRRPGSVLGATLTAGNLVFDTVGRNAHVGEAALPLPRREAALLENLMRRMGRVVPKAVLEEKLYTVDDDIESNAIPVHVHHLRRRLSDAGSTVEIHTVRGVGYLLAEPRPSP